MAKKQCVLYSFGRRLHKPQKLQVKVGRCIKLYRLQRYLKHEHPDHVYAACINLMNMGLAEYDYNKKVIKG